MVGILTSKYSRPTHVSNGLSSQSLQYPGSMPFLVFGLELKMSCFWAFRTKPCKLDVILVLISIADIPVHQKDESEYPVTFSTQKNEIS
ncbi:hypothetical protein Plhal304r1_c059g0147851 [Plasmopara halstedii]